MFKKILLSSLIFATSFAYAATDQCTVSFTPTANGTVGYWQHSCLSVVMYKQTTGDSVGYPLGTFATVQGQAAKFTIPCPKSTDSVVFRVVGLYYPSSASACNASTNAAQVAAKAKELMQTPKYSNNLFGPYYTKGIALTSTAPLSFDIPYTLANNPNTLPKPWESSIEFALTPLTPPLMPITPAHKISE